MKKKRKISEIKKLPILKYPKVFKRFLVTKNKEIGILINPFLQSANCAFYSKESRTISINEINSIILTIKRLVSQRTSKIIDFFIRIFPRVPYTKKPLQTRMGGGKGLHEGFLCILKKGSIFLEIETNDILELKKISKIISRKISFDVGFLFFENI